MKVMNFLIYRDFSRIFRNFSEFSRFIFDFMSIFKNKKIKFLSPADVMRLVSNVSSHGDVCTRHVLHVTK